MAQVFTVLKPKDQTLDPAVASLFCFQLLEEIEYRESRCRIWNDDLSFINSGKEMKYEGILAIPSPETGKWHCFRLEPAVHRLMNPREFLRPLGTLSPRYDFVGFVRDGSSKGRPFYDWVLEFRPTENRHLVVGLQQSLLDSLKTAASDCAPYKSSNEEPGSKRKRPSPNDAET